MSVAILLSFSYHSDDLRCLDGAIVDLYSARKLAISLGYSEIHSLTDVEQNIDPMVANSLMSTHIGPDILRFIDAYTPVGDLHDAFMEILDESQRHPRCLFYFSGHSVNGDLIIPGGGAITPVELRSRLSMFDDTTIILDCCYGPDLSLPYILKDGEFRRVEHISERFYSECRMTLITSTSGDERTVSSRHGSVFTSILVASHTEGLNVVMERMKNHPYRVRQTMSVYSNYPEISESLL